MAFANELELQVAVHTNPGLILQGVPDIDPEFCTDSPQLISLGREVPLGSGPVDNLFVDVNAILTFVECKLYSNGDLKRNVYPQALNYASDLSIQLGNFDGQEFLKEFSTIVANARDGTFVNLEEVMEELSKDDIIEGKNKSEWRRQFPTRLERNVKKGLCRIVILCAPTSKNAFNYSAIRNLMQLMTFSESTGAGYDLILMDIRGAHANAARIVWRRHASLPQIPLVAQSVRDTAASIERVQKLENDFAEPVARGLNDLVDALSLKGVVASANSRGYALKHEETMKSIYVDLRIKKRGWEIVRHQIRDWEGHYGKVKSGDVSNWLGVECQLKRKSSSISAEMYEIMINPVPHDTEALVNAIENIAYQGIQN